MSATSINYAQRESAAVEPRNNFGWTKDEETARYENAALQSWLKHHAAVVPDADTLAFIRCVDARYDVLKATCKSDYGKRVYESARQDRRKFWQQFYIICEW